MRAKKSIATTKHQKGWRNQSSSKEDIFHCLSIQIIRCRKMQKAAMGVRSLLVVKKIKIKNYQEEKRREDSTAAAAVTRDNSTISGSLVVITILSATAFNTSSLPSPIILYYTAPILLLTSFPLFRLALHEHSKKRA